MPRKVLALGVTAGESLTGRRIVIENERGDDLERHLLDNQTQVRVTYHPSSLHWNPDWPAEFGQDVGWLGDP